MIKENMLDFLIKYNKSAKNAEEAIDLVMNTNDLYGKTYYYERFRELLKDYLIIFSSREETAVNLMDNIKHKFHITKEQMFTPFIIETIHFLKYDYQETNGLEMTYDITYDTQIISYFNKLYHNKINNDLENIMSNFRINTRGIFENMQPYILENTLFSLNNEELIRENIFTFFYMLNKNNYSDEENRMNSASITQRNMNQYYISQKNRDFDKLKRLFKVTYINLLKMCLIQIKNKSLYEKLGEYCNFFQNELYIFDKQDLLLAISYFKKGQNLKFFGKIQKGRQDNIKNIKSMAWDIFHLKENIQLLKFNPSFNLNPEINIPVFYSLDKRLNEIKEFYQITGVVINKVSREIRFYPNESLAEESKDIFIKYCSSDVFNERRKKADIVDLDKIIENLENDIGNFSLI